MIKRILLILPSLGYGGAERVTVRLAKSFSESHEVFIMTFLQEEKEYCIEADIKRINISNQSIVKKIVEIRQEITNINPDVVITMFAPLYPIIKCALIGTGLLQIVSERNDPRRFSGRKITKTVYQFFLKKADGIVFQTKEAMDYYFKQTDNAVVIYNPIVKEDLPVPFHGIRKKEIVSVGRLHKQKNQSLLIKAFSEVHRLLPDYKLIIYGEGELRDELQKLINEINATSYITLYGTSNNVLEKINDASLFILSSDFEGMPNALIEAMCLGLPVISTDCPCGGPRELIKNNENGILIQVNDKEGLKKSILKILLDQNYAKRISISASYICDKLDIAKISEEWLMFCERLIKVKRL